MTDARFPSNWLNDRRIQRLSDAHFRSFVTSLAWSVTNRTDGVIEPEDLQYIPGFAPNACQTFIDGDLWKPRGKGWLIGDFAVTQSSRKELEAAEELRIQNRAKDRERKAKARAAAKAPPGHPADVRPDVPVEIHPESSTESKARPRKATTGKDKADHQNVLPMAVGDEWHGTGDNPYAEYK